MSNTEQKATPGALILRNRETFAALGSVQREALSILGDKTLDDISKGYATACAVQQFRNALSDDKIIAPIMALQGNPVGFLTDKDKSGGYDVATVRDSVVTALLLGFRLIGNEFNIISGRFYAAVNGCDRQLNELCAEPPLHEPGIVDFDLEKKRAIIEYALTYRLKGDTVATTVSQRVAVRLQFSRDGMLVTTDDAVIGKARRKVTWSILRSVRGFDGTGVEEGQVEKNVTPDNTAPARSSVRAAAAKSAFAVGAVVDAEVNESGKEGGAA